MVQEWKILNGDSVLYSFQNIALRSIVIFYFMLFLVLFFSVTTCSNIKTKLIVKNYKKCNVY